MPESFIIRYGNFLFRYRNFLFPLALFSLLLTFKPHPFGGNVNSDVWLDIAGVLIIFLGQSIRATVIGLAYIKRGGMNKKIYADSLVTNGLFAHCRNPLYLGNMLIIGGFLVIHNNPWVYMLGAGFFLFSYTAIVLAEEDYLYSQFGDAFRDYCTRAPRWGISFIGLGDTISSMQFKWNRVIAKDYTTAVTWFLTILFLFTEEHISTQGLEASWRFLDTTLVLAVIILAVFLSIRKFKKSGRLAE